MVFLRLLSARGDVPDDKQRQIMVIPHLFAFRRQSCPMARKDKLWSFCTFSPSGDDRVRWHVETNYGHYAPFVIQRRQAQWHVETNNGHSAPFRHPETIVSDGTQRQIMVILRFLSSRDGEPDDMGRQIMVILHHFAIWRRSCPMERRDKLWSFSPFVIQRRRAQWHAVTNYGYSAPFRHPETIVSDGTQLVGLGSSPSMESFAFWRSMAAEWRGSNDDWRCYFKEKMSQEQAHQHRKPWIRAWRLEKMSGGRGREGARKFMPQMRS